MRVCVRVFNKLLARNSYQVVPKYSKHVALVNIEYEEELCSFFSRNTPKNGFSVLKTFHLVVSLKA